MDLAEARFPTVEQRAPFYESFYLTAHDPASPRALWLRHTAWKAPGKPPVGSVWRTMFDLDGPHADKWSTPDLGAEGLIRVGEAVLEEGRGTAPDWELTWQGDRPPFPHLPIPMLYSAPLPRTKSVTLHPRVRYVGEVRVDGRAVDVSGWTGMVGHNWGSEHADRWIWLRGSGPDWLVDMVLGRIRLGPWTTPWIANGVLERAGKRTRLGGLGSRAQVAEREDGGTVRVGPVRLEITAPAASLAGWIYSDPGGGQHQVAHSSVAAMTVQTGGETLRCEHAATWELGRREPLTLTPLLPFTDP